MNRAYSTWDIKSVDDDQRIIEGIASTPTTDRMGDIVEPKGAKFKLPIPLLWQHNASEPIGHVLSAEVTSAGIRIKAQIAKGVLPRIDECWMLIKSGLVRGLSIGFGALESARIEGTHGLKFLSWEWLELSAVTIPANAEASINTIKSIDASDLAASGVGQATKQAGTPGVTGAVVRLAKKDAPTTMKTYTEQITDWTAKKTVAELRMNEIMQKSADEGVTLDDAQKTEYDDLDAEVKSINEHLTRLSAAEARAKSAAVPVAAKTVEEGGKSRTSTPVITVRENIEPGFEFCRVVLCKAAAFSEFTKGNPVSALDIAKQRYPDSARVHLALQQKTAVAGATTTDANWASALLEPSRVLADSFLEYLRPQTIIGKFGTNGIPALKRVPFNVTFQSQTSGASASWVGQGKAKPVTKFNTTTSNMLFTKVAAIAVITEELARFSAPGAESVVRDELSRAVIERLDMDFVDPDKAVSAGVNPASITNGVTPLTTAGTSAANALTDIQALIAPFVTAKYDVSGLVILMPNSLALALSLMLNSLGQRAYPDIEIGGGKLAGIPVITSQYMGSGASYGNMVVALHAPSIALADDGQVSVDASREASIEMSDAPSGDATAGTGASMTSMWQTNSIALRAERVINWKKLRSDAVKFFDDVNWGSVGSPF